MLGYKRKIVDAHSAVFFSNYLVELDATRAYREIMFLLAGNLAAVAAGAVLVFD
jgi:hypothetical protein